MSNKVSDIETEGSQRQTTQPEPTSACTERSTTGSNINNGMHAETGEARGLPEDSGGAAGKHEDPVVNQPAVPKEEAAHTAKVPSDLAGKTTPVRRSSDRKLAANRANAQNSTGPR